MSTGSIVDWGVAQRAVEKDRESGDWYVIKPFPNGVLMAALDGLGHGEEASAAAKIAVDILQAHAQESVISLLKRCHDALRRSRGVVMSLASVNGLDGVMTWSGVGNVEGLLLRANNNMQPVRETLLLRRGVLGNQLPTLQATVIPLTLGDTVVFVTDGIRSGFAEGVERDDPPQKMADRILAQHSKGNDDALVLVARYQGLKR